jgi:hypothetical protein
MTAHQRGPLLEKTFLSIAMQDTKYTTETILVEDGYDGGETERLCKAFGVKYIRRNQRPGIRYSNPAVPNNIGIKAAQGDVIILQNAECYHVASTTPRMPGVIDVLADATINGHAVFANVEAVDGAGKHLMWYCHPEKNPRPFFFCGALLRAHFTYLRGFDEDYKLYGWDDNDFADRLAYVGVRFDFRNDAHVIHQWHGPSFLVGEPNSESTYTTKTEDFKAGRIGPIRNTDREWGVD